MGYRLRIWWLTQATKRLWRERISKACLQILEARLLAFLKRTDIIAVRMEELTVGGENASHRPKKSPLWASKAIVGLPPPLKRIR